MPYLLKNNKLEIKIDLPNENYDFSRFDRTGKIVSVKYQENKMCTSENINSKKEHALGKGLYNEFGVQSPIGFNETPINGWFHKIGVGLLRKKSTEYFFGKKYEVKPAKFKIIKDTKQIHIHCESEVVNGYSYILEKKIVLKDDFFTIDYRLQNTGSKVIDTNEYAHNFMAINNQEIGREYLLKFPFQLQIDKFTETVNPEQKVLLNENIISFKDTINETFFFGNLSGNENVVAQWELININSKIGVRETGDFKTNEINLWGNKHVISPELFIKINLEPKESKSWTRKYSFHTTT